MTVIRKQLDFQPIPLSNLEEMDDVAGVEILELVVRRRKGAAVAVAFKAVQGQAALAAL